MHRCVYDVDKERYKRWKKYYLKLAEKVKSPIFALPKTKKGNDSVAQLVEQYTFNVWVLGSSPNGITEVRVTVL